MGVPDLLTTLRRYWGYDSFRPLQERIVASIMGGHDVCVVMPTGGGKSLCYQMPAVVSEKTAIVISPLIALMQDQALQLSQMGIPAAVLNSTLPSHEQSAVMKKARAGEYRLLYLSPERLARADSIAWLRQVPVAFFAIDEAHCISEWGHEFRPEYRQLSALKVNFPDRPIAAFTASATRRVRHDILHQLQLKDPHKYIASFHRPNLHYVIRKCDYEVEQLDLLAGGLNSYGDGSVIVYSPTIARVAATVAFLQGQGIAAAGYHGQMNAVERRASQERWMSDEVRVMVGTIAFGLGINKAAVRAVIHLSLPKSLEQYYQEAGRAGRDGKAADCVLLWQKRDTALLAHFIDEIEDPAEKSRAWERYRVIRDFAQSSRCRHRQISQHFGETPRWNSCESCDVCGYRPVWMQGAAGKKEEQIPHGLKPVRNDKSLGIVGTGGKRLDKSGKRSVIELQPLPDADHELREYLRDWRRTTARAHNIPAFVVMHDTSLEELCRVKPKSVVELRKTYGFGEKKVALYGKEIIEVLNRFRAGARVEERIVAGRT
jgi:ATP-dependent DNA helicase RecQ